MRILREVFQGTGYNPCIINLFTPATPKPNDLFESWSSRDCPSFELQNISPNDFSAVMYAYDVYELRKGYSSDIKRRTRLVKSLFDSIPEIVVPLASSNTPKHPMRIQIEGLKDVYRSRVTDMFNAKN